MRIEAGSRRYIGLVAALLMAAGIQCFVASRSAFIAPDGITFIKIARLMSSDPQKAIREHAQHPGYPLLVAVCQRGLLTAGWRDDQHTWVVAAETVSGIGGLVGVLMVWLLARRLSGDAVANTAALIFAAYPLARENAADALSDSTHLALYGLAAWTACEGFSRGPVRWFAVSGIAGGLAFLVRPEGLGIVVATGAVLLWQFVLDSTACRRATAASLAALLITAAVCVTPYAAYTGHFSKKVNDKFEMLREQLDTKSAAVAQTASPESVSSQGTVSTPATSAPGRGKLARAPAPRKPSELAVMAGRLPAAMMRLLREIIERMNVLIIGWLLWLWWGRDRVAPRLLQVVVGAGVLHLLMLFTLSWFAGYIDRRHLLPVAFLTTPLSAAGVLWCAVDARLFLAPSWKTKFLPQAVVGLILVLLIPRAARPLHRETEAQQAAITWLRPRLAMTDRVVSNSVMVPFFLGRSGRILDVKQSEQKQAEVLKPPTSGRRIRKYQWVVLDEQIDGHFDPGWPARMAANYAVVWDSATTFRHRVRIYRSEPIFDTVASRPAN